MVSVDLERLSSPTTGDQDSQTYQVGLLAERVPNPRTQISSRCLPLPLPISPLPTPRYTLKLRQSMWDPMGSCLETTESVALEPDLWMFHVSWRVSIAPIFACDLQDLTDPNSEEERKS